MAVLIEIRGDHQREYRLGPTNLIGRAAGATIRLADPLISREHARISRNGDGDYEIADLDSRHGTFVAAERISRHVLADGDEVILGATRLRFRGESHSGSGRRWSERVPCDLDVIVELASGEQIDGRATDMSNGGMGLVLDRRLELDSKIHLAIAFANRRRRLKTDARVTRVDDRSTGVSFLPSSEQTRLRLAEEFALLLRASQNTQGRTG